MSGRNLAWRAANHVLRHHYRFAIAAFRLWTWGRNWLLQAEVDHLAGNLALAFPDWSRAAQRTLARQCAAGIRLDEFHQYRLELLPRDRLVREVAAVEIKGAGHLEEAYRGTRPVIFVTAHYGAYMLAALKVALELPHRRVNFFYNPTERNAYAATSDALLSLVNESCGILHTSPKGIVGAIKCLGRGESLCIVADQLTPDGEIAFVPFFGRFYGAMQGVAYFAHRTQALILPVFAHTDHAGRTTMEILPPVESAGGDGTVEERQYRTTCALFRAFEGQIRATPTHWKYWRSFKRCSLDFPRPSVNSEDAQRQLSQVSTLLAHDRVLLAERSLWDAVGRVFAVPK